MNLNITERNARKQGRRQKKITNIKSALFEKKKPCSFDGVTHYSWDYAEQLHYPQSPGQYTLKHPESVVYLESATMGLISNIRKGSQYNNFVCSSPFGKLWHGGEKWLNSSNCTGINLATLFS